MALPQSHTPMTRSEFVAWENAQSDKHEFVAGEVFAMVGARRVHVAVMGNCYAALRQHLKGSPCRAFMADMKLEVAAADAIYYPDLLVTCDPRDLATEYVMAHPKVIIEVLSDSTAAHDRGDKFAAYRTLESLEEYALIDPQLHTIEVFRRTGKDWLLATSESPRGLVLKSIDFEAAPALVFEDTDYVAPGS